MNTNTMIEAVTNIYDLLDAVEKKDAENPLYKAFCELKETVDKIAEGKE